MGGAPGSRDTPSEDGSGLEEADRDQITPPLGAACGRSPVGPRRALGATVTVNSDRGEGRGFSPQDLELREKGTKFLLPSWNQGSPGWQSWQRQPREAGG